MATQFADSMIIDNVDRVSQSTALSRTAAVELALDLWLSEMSDADERTLMADRIARLDEPFEPIN
jgi:hypothetical protein